MNNTSELEADLESLLVPMDQREKKTSTDASVESVSTQQAR